MVQKKNRPTATLVLAAGQGTRMRSQLPKVLHPIAGEPMLFFVLDKILAVAPDALMGIVVGHRSEDVKSAVMGEARFSKRRIQFIEQPQRLGTGHAVATAWNTEWGKLAQTCQTVLVCPGDAPLISSDLMNQMVQPLAAKTALRVLTCDVPDPSGLGRIIRSGKAGSVTRIIEEKDASARERSIREINAAIYLFDSAFLGGALTKISNQNAQKEYYLTDTIELAARTGKKVEAVKWTNLDDLQFVNNQWELARARKILNQRILKKWADLGVRLFETDHTWIDRAVEISPGALIHAGCHLRGKTRIGPETVIGPNCILTDMIVGGYADLLAGTYAEDSEIADGAHVGPYARLRPGSRVGTSAKIGNFVELKKTSVGKNSSIAHLSYLGDAEVGERVNIGCGFITCNFDGRVVNGERKHRTVIEDGVFMGSDCQTVAPVKIGKGSYIASGSTITKDVEPESLAIARSRQVNKPGYANRLKPTGGKSGREG